MGLADKFIALLILVFFLLLIGSIPRWPYSKSWGYGPCAGMVVIGVILMLDGW